MSISWRQKKLSVLQVVKSYVCCDNLRLWIIYEYLSVMHDNVLNCMCSSWLVVPVCHRLQRPLPAPLTLPQTSPGQLLPARHLPLIRRLKFSQERGQIRWSNNNRVTVTGCRHCAVLSSLWMCAYGCVVDISVENALVFVQPFVWVVFYTVHLRDYYCRRSAMS